MSDIYRQPKYDWYICPQCGLTMNISPAREAVDATAGHDPRSRAGTVVRCMCQNVMMPLHPRGMDRIASHILYQRTWPEGMNHGPL